MLCNTTIDTVIQWDDQCAVKQDADDGGHMLKTCDENDLWSAELTCVWSPCYSGRSRGGKIDELLIFL